MSTEGGPESQEAAPNGLAKTVARGAGIAAGGYASAQGINLLIYLVLARLLTPSDFGAFAAATVLLGFMALVTDSGMTSALVHRKDRLDEALSTATFSTVTGGLLLGLAGLAVAPVIGFFFDSSRIGELAAAMSGIVVLRTATSVPTAILQRNFSFLRQMVVEPTQVFVFGAVAIPCAIAGLGPWSLVAGQYGGALVDTVICWLMVDFRPRWADASWSMWRELAGYGRHVLLATVILRAGESSDTVIVGKGLSAASLGQFRYAARLATTPFQLLLAAASFVLFPAFARIAEERDRFHAGFLRSLRWMCVLGFPAGLLIVPLGVPLAELLFGHVWRDAGYAAMGMGLFTGAGCVSSIASEALKAVGSPDRLTRMHLLTAIVTVVAMLALLPFGLSVVAIGVSVGAVAGAVLGLVYMVKVVSLRPRALIAEVWPPLLAALTMAGALTALEFLVIRAAERGTLVGLLLVLAEALLAAVVYVAVLAVLAPRTAAELLGAVRSAPGTLADAVHGTPDQEALAAAEPGLPGSDFIDG